MKVAVLAGDGIGPEIMSQAIRVLERVCERFNHRLDLRPATVGGVAFEKYGSHFPPETEAICRDSEAILFGTIGGPLSEAELPKWKNCERNSILAIRKAFQFFANLRPVSIYPELASACPLRPEIFQGGVDLVIVRELVGGIYFGERGTSERNGRRYAFDTAEYDEAQIAQIARVGFETARQRRKGLVSVDKANVLDTSRLWRAVVREISREYPDVNCSDMLVDNCAMQLIRNPVQFDVIVTSNLFGDILSDAAAVLPGSLGLLASASLNGAGFGLYEPPSGSAPDIAGRGIANPIGQILSVALMLRYSFSLEREARAVEESVRRVVHAGARTADIALGGPTIGTVEMTELILREFDGASVA